MRKTLWITILLAFSVAGAEEDSFLIKRFPRRVHVVFTLTPKVTERGSYKQLILLPLPRSDEKREIENLKVDMPAGMTPDPKRFPETGDMYLPILTQGSLRENVTIEYDAVLYSVHYRLPRAKDIIPYDKASTTYKLYTGKDRRFEPQHPQITRIADDIWSQSSDLVEYSHKVYAYQQRNLKWKNTGSYGTVSEIFANGGGDCGALTTIYVSLLRNKGIPARAHVGGVIQGKDNWAWHVWPEFYLEKKGWVETDPAYFASPPGYFAYDDSRRIHFHRGSTVTVDYDEFKFQTGGIQRYAYSNRRSSRSAERVVESLMGESPVNYAVSVSVTTKSPTEGDGGLNSEAQAKHVADAVAQYVTRKRAAKGLSIQLDADISRALTRTLADTGPSKERGLEQDCRTGCVDSVVRERATKPVGEALKEGNVQLSKYSWESHTVGFHALDPVPYASAALNQTTMLKPDWKQVGVGYYFDPTERVYRIAVLYGVRK